MIPVRAEVGRNIRSAAAGMLNRSCAGVAESAKRSSALSLG